jgi:hypothetical protein
MSRTATSVPFALLLLSLPAVAQMSAIPIGGPDSLASGGYDDPGLLDDGETEARGRFEFTLDVPAATLTLVVQNFSPVEPGVPNPVITRVYFNTPSGITGMTLVSQSAAAGDVEPAFALTFDADRTSSPNPNAIGRFGAFNAYLDNGGGIHGGIANADADTLAQDDAAIGPVTFVLSLQGDLSDVEAEDFVTERTSNPPGEESVVAAAKFQGGGEDESSAFITSEDPFCGLVAEVEDLGGGCGPNLVCDLPVQGETWEAHIESAPPGALGVLVIAPLPARPIQFQGCDIILDVTTAYKLATFTVDGNGEGTIALPVRSYHDSVMCCGIEGIVQVGFRTGLVFQGATNACRVRLGS